MSTGYLMAGAITELETDGIDCKKVQLDGNGDVFNDVIAQKQGCESLADKSLANDAKLYLAQSISVSFWRPVLTSRDASHAHIIRSIFVMPEAQSESQTTNCSAVKPSNFVLMLSRIQLAAP